MPLIGYDVFLEGEWIDAVFFTSEQDAEEVRRSLVDHDGYDARIEVVRQAKGRKIRPV